VAESAQVPRHPALSAPDVECQISGRRDELEEAVAVKSPVAVVIGCPRPEMPLVGVRLPRVRERPSLDGDAFNVCRDLVIVVGQGVLGWSVEV
jgi:hypothetical protein